MTLGDEGELDDLDSEHDEASSEEFDDEGLGASGRDENSDVDEDGDSGEDQPLASTSATESDDEGAITTVVKQVKITSANGEYESLF